MKRLTCGLAAAGLLALAPMAATAASLNEAFAAGEVSGHVGAYGVWNKEKDSDRDGFISGSASLSYETAPFHRLSLGLGAWGTTRIHQRNDGDYRNDIASDAIIHQAYLRYSGDGWGQVVAGRQEIDLEWLNDYVMGLVIEAAPVEGLELTLGWAGRQAAVDLDEVSESFAKMNDNNGLYFVDFQYSPLDWLVINPYYYHASDMFRAPGLKLTAEYSLVDGLDASTMAQFVHSGTPSGVDNGNYFWLEQGLAYGDFAFSGGYMKANSKGVGGIDSFGDQMPFEEGNNIYSEDARTWYLGLEYQWQALSLAALYGETRYDLGAGRVKEKELNLLAGYTLYENLDIEAAFANVRNDNSADSYHTFSLALVYNF